MRKIIMAVAAAGLVAALAVPALASADVQRYQTQTGTITVSLPEYGLVHTFTVNGDVSPCLDGSFTATGTRNVGGVVETVTGTIKDNQLSFNAIYTDSNYQSEIGYNWHTIAPIALNGSGQILDSTGLVSDVTVSSSLTPSNWKNHGDYVAHSGVDDAAHSCIGMPINSSGK